MYAPSMMVTPGRAEAAPAVEEVLGNVRSLLPAFADTAAETEGERRVSDEAMAALVDAGVFRLMMPSRYSGLEAMPVELFAAIRAISSACTNTGWVASSLAMGTWQVGLFDERAQEEVWGGDPAALIASAYQPVGRLQPEGDHYRLSGSWKYVSGGEHCEWLFIGALVLDASGSPVEHALVLVPRSDVSTTMGPDCVGLRAAANTDVTIDAATVPAHRVYGAKLRALRSSPENRRELPPMHRYPVTPLYTSSLTVPLIGAAEGAYSIALDLLAGQSEQRHVRRRALDNDSVQSAVAFAAYEIDGAVLQLERDLTEMHAFAVSGEEIPESLSARMRRDQVLGTRKSADAVDRLLRAGGRQCLALDNPIQRFWRDIHTGASHRVNDVEETLSMVGRATLGLNTDEPFFV